MKSIEIFTVIGISLTALLGFFNLYINLRSERKSHRELIFSAQFDFFMNLHAISIQFEDAIYNVNTEYTNPKQNQELIFKLANDIDDLISKNELIIPDNLFLIFSDYASYCHKIFTLSVKDSQKFDTNFKNNFIKENSNLLNEMREYIGIEKLSEENRKLVQRNDRLP